MKATTAVLGLVIALGSSAPALAGEGAVPTGIPHLDHVFVIMMENHGYSQIIGNPNAPFMNQLAASANLATNYFAVGHPSLTNYLEVVGGSNFGVRSDNPPDWHDTGCASNLATGVPNTDNPSSPPVCPIFGTGTDAETPAVDTTNEVQGPPGLCDIDCVKSVPAAPGTIGKTIATQLVQNHLSWKSYQESLSPNGADGINYSDSFYDNTTNFSAITPTLNPPLTQSDIVQLYAAKHNPFVYFKSVQQDGNPSLSLANTVGFDGAGGLWADLAAGTVPNYAFIAPNQCNDQHGRGNAGPFCLYDPKSDGTQAGMNPALTYRADVTVQKIVTAIQASPVWTNGNNAIVVMYDENDYSNAPNTNQVVLIVDTNYGRHGVQAAEFFTHFSLLKSIEAGFGLPCLNHACDNSARVMSRLF